MSMNALARYAWLCAALLLLPCSCAWSADPITLTAGQLSMVFEPDNALLRYIRIGSMEVLRGINAPVRNQFWGTVPPIVENLEVDQRDDSFTMAFDVRCQQREIDFRWHGEISASKDGRLQFTFDGHAHSTFLRNRIGFCVLHGPLVAGVPCKLETVDGQIRNGRFPKFISPHQPFKDLRMLSHELAPGVWAHVRMEGDTFETEDQRNWTDASFKTYCTPLELPYPVEISKGTRISHKITLSIEGDTAQFASNESAGDETVVIRAAGRDAFAPHDLPGIGLQISSEQPHLTDKQQSRLKSLDLDHLRVDLDLADDEWIEELRRGSQQAKALNVKLHIGIHLSEDVKSELHELSKAVQSIRPPVAYWLLISPSENAIASARSILSTTDRHAHVGVGENTNFTELNRQRPDVTKIDAVSYGMNPQVHAFDNLSMIETLAIQADTVLSARQFIGDSPLLISPITLRKQLVDQQPMPSELPSNVDPRQATLFGAAWTLGSIRYLAPADVQGLTYFETVGMKGVMSTESGPSLTNLFPAKSDNVYPVYHVLQWLGEFAGGKVAGLDSSDPMAVIGLRLVQAGRRRLIIANLTDQPRKVEVQGLDAEAIIFHLNQSNLDSAMNAPESLSKNKGARAGELEPVFRIELPPHGLVRIDD